MRDVFLPCTLDSTTPVNSIRLHCNRQNPSRFARLSTSLGFCLAGYMGRTGIKSNSYLFIRYTKFWRHKHFKNYHQSCVYIHRPALAGSSFCHAHAPIYDFCGPSSSHVPLSHDAIYPSRG